MSTKTIYDIEMMLQISMRLRDKDYVKITKNVDRCTLYVDFIITSTYDVVYYLVHEENEYHCFTPRENVVKLCQEASLSSP